MSHRLGNATGVCSCIDWNSACFSRLWSPRIWSEKCNCRIKTAVICLGWLHFSCIIWVNATRRQRLWWILAGTWQKVTCQFYSNLCECFRSSWRKWENFINQVTEALPLGPDDTGSLPPQSPAMLRRADWRLRSYPGHLATPFSKDSHPQEQGAPSAESLTFEKADYKYDK